MVARTAVSLLGPGPIPPGIRIAFDGIDPCGSVDEDASTDWGFGTVVHEDPTELVGELITLTFRSRRPPTSARWA